MTFDISDGLTDATLMVFAAVWESYENDKTVIISVFDDLTQDIVEAMLSDITEMIPEAAMVSCERETVH